MHARMDNAGAGAKLLIVTLALDLLSAGCMSTAAIITANSSESSPAALSSEEQLRLLHAIEARLEELSGASTPSNLEDIRRAYESHSDDGYWVVTVFSTGKPFPMLKVFVLENKDRAVRVIVDNQGGWPLGIPFTNSVVDVTELAFSDVLPNHTVVVERHTGFDLR